MSKKQGFTLIELLAVIVILAIIALIATPVILGIIESTRKSANERSLELYLKAVENSIIKAQMNTEFSNVEDGYHSIDKHGNICLDYLEEDSGECADGDMLVVEVDNIKTISGTIKTQNGVVIGYDITINGQHLSTEEPEVTDRCTVTSGNGTNLGDIITCGTESFYVISNNGEKIDMLAKYRITNDTVPTQNSNGPSVEWQTAVDAATRYGEYMMTYSDQAYATLLTQEQSIILKMNECSSTDSEGNWISTYGSPDWARSTGYWFGFGDNDTAYYWTKSAYSGYYYYKEKVDRYSWIRPVVTIPISDLG